MASPVAWTGLVNCTNTSGVLIKTSGSLALDDGTATAANQKLYGAGYIEITVTRLATEIIQFGLSNVLSTNVNTVDFSVILDNNHNAAFVESGSLYVTAGGAFIVGDVFKIDVDAAGTVKYYKNGTLKRTSGTTATFPLSVDVRLSVIGARVESAGIYGVTVPVQFTDLSSSSTLSWLWDFGDGASSTVQNPNHTYAADGTYTVTLFATSATGTVAHTRTVTIVGGLLTAYAAASPSYAPGTDPQVMLRVSNDGGKTWVSELWRSAGKAGEYLRRVRWNRLGVARRRVFEVSVTDPSPWRLTGAYVETSAARDSKNG